MQNQVALLEKEELNCANLLVNCSGFNIGLSDGSAIPAGKRVGECANSYAVPNLDFCRIAGMEYEHEWPIGAIRPEVNNNGDVDGCGLVMKPNNELSIFFTFNGTLIG